MKILKQLGRGLVIIISILLVGVLLYFGYISLFNPRDSKINLVLTEVDGVTFRLKNQSCPSNISDPLANYIDLQISNPVQTDYIVKSNSTPIYVTMALKHASYNAKFWNDDKDKENPLTSSEVITDVNTRFSFQATRIKINFDKREDINLRQRICNGDVYFDPKQGFLYLPNQSIGGNLSSVSSSQGFARAGQTYNIEVDNIDSQNQKFNKAIISVVGGSQYDQGYMAIRTEGESLDYTLPNGNFFDKSLSVKLEQADVRELILTHPVGKLALDYEGTIDITPPISYLDPREMRLGDSTSLDYFLVFPGNQGGYEISGQTNSIIWTGNQIIRSIWGTVTPELQAVYLTIFLGIFVGISRWALLKRVDKPKPIQVSIDIQEKIAKSTVPIGYQVMMLSSGISVAGMLRRKPTFFNRKYVLLNAISKRSNGEWSSDIIPELEIESRQVLYTYINTNNKVEEAQSENKKN